MQRKDDAVTLSVDRWVDSHVHPGTDEGDDLDELAKGLRDVFDREEVDLRFISSPGGSWLDRVADSEEGVAEAHDLLNQLVKRFPNRMYGSCMVNPHYLDASLAVMEQCFEEWGFVQLGELVTYMMNYNMNTPEMERIVRKAVEYRVPIHVHVSTSNMKPQGHFASGEEELEDMLALVDRVPEGKYIIAHGIGAPLIHPPVIETYLGMIERRYGKWPDNLWIEIMHFHAEGVKVALQHIPAARMLAGTDWTPSAEPPYPAYGSVFGPAEEEQPYPPCVASLVGYLVEAGADEAAVKRIAWQNAFEIFGLKG